MGESGHSAAQAAAPLCAICQSALAPGEAKTVCPACRTEYHQDCWQENGGCAVYGCSKVPPTEARKPVEMPASYWGQQWKACPQCNVSIEATAYECRHCGATFSSARPEDARLYRRRSAMEQSLPALKRWANWLFALCLLPCTAPLAGLAGLIWYVSRRDQVKALPPLQGGLCKIGIIVGLGQSVIALLAAILYAILRG